MRLHTPHTWGETLGWALGAYLLGVASHSLFPWTHVLARLLVPALIISALCAALFRRRMPSVAACCLFAFIFGVWRFDASIPRPADGVLPWIGGTVRIEGKIVALGISRGQSLATVDAAFADGRRITGQARRVIVKTARAPEVGSRIAFSCELRVPGTFPSNVERRGSLARKGIWAECARSVDVETVAPAEPWDAFALLARLRGVVTRRLQSVLPPDEAELVAGILYGDQDLAPDLKADFQRAGLMHLVAVSGSNITILTNVLMALLLRFRLKRRQAFWAVTAAIALFVGFVGFGASVLRAAFMGWLVLLARELGRVAWTDRLLLVAASALNLLNPRLLVFDPGFALSFLATWGLLAWTPLFAERLARIPEALAMRETVTTTLGATLMTAPYLAWAFGRMTLAGLVTNVLALPLVPWTMLWGAVSAVWGDAWGSVLVSAPSIGLARLIIHVAELSRRLPWLDMHVPRMDAFLLFATYGLMWYWWRSFSDSSALSTPQKPFVSDSRPTDA